MANARPHVRHLPRYTEIGAALIKYNFGDIVARTGLRDRIDLKLEPDADAGDTAPAAEDADGEASAAENFRLMLEALGPAWIKLGQLLSTRPDIVPPQFVTELAQLQDQVPPAEWEDVKAVLEAELEAPAGTVFEWLDPEPLGSASLAQVHAGRLHDGTEVAVKIQRPDIQEIVETDLEIMHDLAQMMQQRTELGEIHDLPGIAEDFADTLRTEMDYRREASYAERFRRNFEGIDYVHIPAIYWEFVTRRLLVMERLEGIKIDQPEALQAAGYDLSRIAQKATDIAVREILEDGFFHADPHAGNFMILPGEVIGPMDFGQVGFLERRLRMELAQIYLGIVHRDAEEIVSHLTRMGMVDYESDREALHRDVARLLRRYQGLSYEDVRLDAVMEDIMALAYEHHLHFPSDLWLLTKVLIVLDGMARQLDPDFDVWEATEPHVERLQREMLLPRTWMPEIVDSLGDWVYLLRIAPEALGDAMRRLQEGDFEVGIQVRGLESPLDRLDRIADRIAVSILVAAMIIGMALLIPALNREARGDWLQVAFIGIFMAMVGLGLWLAWNIMRSGREGGSR